MAGVSGLVSSARDQALPLVTESCPAPVRALVPALRVLEPAPQPEAANLLSPTQVRTFLDCSAKWWFRYGLRLPEPKTSSLALGSAVHEALAENFRQKIETREDLEACGVRVLFRQSWSRQTEEAVFQPDENAGQLGSIGEELVQKYMEEAAPSIDPAGVEFEVTGRIAGVSVRGIVDLIDVHGAVIDIKTAARKPSGISFDHALQLATYRCLSPHASGEARLDTLVKTKTVQLVQHRHTVTDSDLQAARVLYPLVQDGIRSGLYFPNRRSLLCSRRNCAFWQKCEREFGGSVGES
jgi:CRISPR/Cas system-associated exonuclease Cas4 (RecB family)